MFRESGASRLVRFNAGCSSLSASVRRRRPQAAVGRCVLPGAFDGVERPVTQRVTEQLAQRVAGGIRELLGGRSDDSDPLVCTGMSENHSAPYVICWEAGPFQWAYRVDVLQTLQRQMGVQLETVNHFTIAVIDHDATNLPLYQEPRR